MHPFRARRHGHSHRALVNPVFCRVALDDSARTSIEVHISIIIPSLAFSFSSFFCWLFKIILIFLFFLFSYPLSISVLVFFC